MLHRTGSAFYQHYHVKHIATLCKRSLSTFGPVSTALENKVRCGMIQQDDAQTMLAKKLDSIYNNVLFCKENLRNDIEWKKKFHDMEDSAFQEGTIIKMLRRWTQRYWNRNRITTTTDMLLSSFHLSQHQLPHKGIYIHGSVGTGKSLLMDMFYHEISNTLLSSSPSLGIQSRRVHFHEFMLDVHNRIHQFKKIQPQKDALQHIAIEIANESQLLCFDEFQVTDIADAMIIKRLFEFLLYDLNVIVVATSNRPPERLYEGGLNRSLFLPFIETLKEMLDVVCIESTHDYRRDKIKIQATQQEGEGGTAISSPSYLTSYFWPNSSTNVKTIHSLFGSEEEESYEETVPVIMGRKIVVPRANKHCAWFSFQELCSKPLGAADYIALANRFQVIIVHNIPQLGAEHYNEARRFVTFIDALYEARTRLVVVADVPLEDLFKEFEINVETSDGDEEIITNHDMTIPNSKIQQEEIFVHGEGGSSSSKATTMVRTKVGDVEWSATGRVGVSLAQLSATKEVIFSFRRAESRLFEMNGIEWSMCNS